MPKDISGIDFDTWSDERIYDALRAAGYRVADPTRKIVAIPLHRYQRAVRRSKARRKYVFAGSGGGKTTIGPLELLDAINRHRGDPVKTQRYLVAAPTTDLLFPAYAEAAPWLKRLGDPKYGDSRDGYVRSTKTWHLKGGAQVRFRSLDRLGSIEGVHYRFAWVDEAGQINDAAHAAVLRRLALLEGELLVTTTPYVTEGWTRDIIDLFDARTDKDLFVLHFPSIANPTYPRAEFERLLATEPWWRFAMFHLGLLTKPEGAMYPNFDRNTHVVDPFRPLAGWAKYVGIDFGFNHPTAIVWGALSASTDRLYVYKEWVMVEQDVTTIANAILADRPRRVFCDPSAAQIIAELRAKGVPVSTDEDLMVGGKKIKINDVKGGVAMVYSRLQDRSLLFMRGRVPKVIAGIERVRWEPGKETQHKVDDDEADATRYLVVGTRPLMLSRPLQTPRKTEGAARPITAGQRTRMW